MFANIANSGLRIADFGMGIENCGVMETEQFSNVESAHVHGRRHGFWCGFLAVVGALAIGVTLPTMLVCWSFGREGIHVPMLDDLGKQRNPDWESVIQTWINLQITATIFCGPGALILGYFIYASCKKLASGTSFQFCHRSGVIDGAGIAFLNVPAYFVGFLITQPHAWLKLPLLFLVAGASSGLWIAWQAWRSVHPEERFWPRFSLGTLLIVVLAWGALLAVFAPR